MYHVTFNTNVVAESDVELFMLHLIQRFVTIEILWFFFSLLSQAINSAVKDLEHAVDAADWFFQSEPQPPPTSYHQQPIGGKPLDGGS